MVEVSIIGGSGFVGGELLRLLLFHPEVTVKQVTSETHKGKFVKSIRPHLRQVTDIKFSSVANLQSCDTIFLALPHGRSFGLIQHVIESCNNVIDLSADYRLRSEKEYERWYGEKHLFPELLRRFVYGIPELYRKDMSKSNLVSSAGCNATASILALHPIFQEIGDQVRDVVIDVKVGSSEGGKSYNQASHHPIRAGSLRSYKPVMHRHSAEINQELFSTDRSVYFSATSTNIVRGLLATSQVLLEDSVSEKDVWKMFRKHYSSEPFIRLVNDKQGLFRYPDPKTLAGSNFCDIGFASDPDNNRLVVISAIDNLMKGAAGQAVQAFNIMHSYDEVTGLQFPGLYPV